MFEYASVVSINDNNIINVSCDTQVCNGCQASTFCQTKGKSFNATNSDNIALSVGDMVEIYLPPGKTVFATFMALLVPLLLFPVGYYLSETFVSNPKEITRVLFGIAAMAVGFLISRIFSHFKGSEYTPKITRIIDPKEIES